MTIEQVKQFSEMATVEMTRDWGSTFLLVGITIATLVFLTQLIIAFKENWKDEEGKPEYITIIFFAVFAPLIMAIACVFTWATLTQADTPLEGEVLNYKAKQTQWTREYVNPYVEQLPIQKEDLKQLEYNYLLGEEKIKNGLEEDFKTPIKAVTESGKTITGWAKVEMLGSGETERIEYVHLSEELVFGTEEARAAVSDSKKYKAGNYRIVVYTKKELVD